MVLKLTGGLQTTDGWLRNISADAAAAEAKLSHLDGKLTAFAEYFNFDLAGTIWQVADTVICGVWLFSILRSSTVVVQLAGTLPFLICEPIYFLVVDDLLTTPS